MRIAAQSSRSENFSEISSNVSADSARSDPEALSFSANISLSYSNGSQNHLRNSLRVFACEGALARACVRLRMRVLACACAGVRACVCMCWSACLPACLPDCLPACLPACVPAIVCFLSPFEKGNFSILKNIALASASYHKRRLSPSPQKI